MATVAVSAAGALIDRDATPQPPRFTGNAPTQARALALWRYTRVMSAVNAFEDGIDLRLRIIVRVRWSIGLHRELVRAILFPIGHRY